MSSTQKTPLVIVDVFIGNDRRIGIKKENYWVRSIDLKHPELSTSEEMVTINKLVEYVSKIAIKKVDPKHKLATPLGVRGRNSENRLIERELKWKLNGHWLTVYKKPIHG